MCLLLMRLLYLRLRGCVLGVMDAAMAATLVVEEVLPLILILIEQLVDVAARD